MKRSDSGFEKLTKLFLVGFLAIVPWSPVPTASGEPNTAKNETASSRQEKPSQTDKNNKKESSDQTLKIKTQLLEIRGIVTDKQGQVVSGLTRESFEVLEEGKPQSIEFFAAETDSRATAPDGGANASPDAHPPLSSLPGASMLHRDPPRRVIGLFVDNLNMSASSLLPAKQALRKFIREKLTDRDLVAIVPSGGASGLLGQFTEDRDVMALAISRLGLARPTITSSFTPYLAAQIKQNDPQALELGIALAQSEDKMMNGDRKVLEDYVKAKAVSILAEAENRTRISLSTLKALVDRMAPLPGQKTIAMLSDGFNLRDSGGAIDTAGIQAVTTRAVRSGVVIYSIDAAGLRGPAGFSATVRNQVGQRPDLLNRYDSDAEKEEQQGLSALAFDTGGEAIRNTNDIISSMERAVDANQTSYLLAYYPSDAGNPRKFRKITVRVKDHPDYKLRALKGYLPADLAKEAEKLERDDALAPREKMMKAMLAPLPTTDLQVDVEANYYEKEGQSELAYLKTFIGGQALTFQPDEQGNHFKLEFVSVIYDTAGKPVDTDSNTIEGSVKSDGLEAVKRSGFTRNRQVPLKPGSYQVRIAVREAETGKLGTASAWIHVPDLTKKRIVMSNVFVGNDAETMTVSATADDNARNQKPGTVYREGIKFFKNRDTLVYYFKVYNSSLAPGKTGGLLMKFEFVQGDETVLESEWSDAANRLIGQDQKGVDIGGAFGLARLKPGFYELKISFKEPKSKQPTLQGSVFFGVEK